MLHQLYQRWAARRGIQFRLLKDFLSAVVGAHMIMYLSVRSIATSDVFFRQDAREHEPAKSDKSWRAVEGPKRIREKKPSQVSGGLGGGGSWGDALWSLTVQELGVRRAQENNNGRPMPPEEPPNASTTISK